jgi:hypothetical protein
MATGTYTTDWIVLSREDGHITKGSYVFSVDEHIENATHASTVTRDSQTILLEGESLPGGSFIHLYDSTPYQINNGHVAAKVPCGEDNQTSVNILLG